MEKFLDLRVCETARLLLLLLLSSSLTTTTVDGSSVLFLRAREQKTNLKHRYANLVQGERESGPDSGTELRLRPR